MFDRFFKKHQKKQSFKMPIAPKFSSSKPTEMFI